ncbi:MAG: hypothetical protein HRT36_02040 [Alphaproteobacteria bacterium]|nr:hypothetical protein [Alphaproteobacteria bacterium]
MNLRVYKTNNGHAIAEAALHRDGIYGKVGLVLNANDALAIGCTFGTMLKTKDQCLVIVGQDNRTTSEILETEMCRGLAASGCYVMRAGVSPNPAVQFSAYCLGAASVMITGSGDHYDVNGFRLCVDQVPIHDTRLRRLAALSANGNWRKDRGGALEGNILEVYIKKLKQLINSKRHFKIAWDLCGGTACTVLPEISNKILGEHLMMNDTLDGQFGDSPPNSFDPTRIANLTEVVIEEKCDFGCILNADSTQIAVVDDQGQLWSSPRLFALLSENLMKRAPKTPIVVGMNCPLTIRHTVEKHDGKLHYATIGLGGMLEQMVSIDSGLGYDDHGRYAYGKIYNYAPFDDGLFTAITLLNLLSDTTESLSSAYHRFIDDHRYPTRHFRHQKPEKVIQAVRKRLLINNVLLNDLDGVRCDRDQGWWWMHLHKEESTCLLALDVAASSEGTLNEMVKEAEQYIALVARELAPPEEVKTDISVPTADIDVPKSVKEGALKDISETDREVIDFASRHWCSIRKTKTTPSSAEDTPKPK